MGGNSHYSACPVFHQDKIGNEDGHSGLCHRIEAITAREDTLFLRCGRGPLHPVLPFHLLDKILHLFLLGGPLRKGQGKRMLRSKAHKGSAKDRVLPGGEDLDRFL